MDFSSFSLILAYERDKCQDSAMIKLIFLFVAFSEVKSQNVPGACYCVC